MALFCISLAAPANRYRSLSPSLSPPPCGFGFLPNINRAFYPAVFRRFDKNTLFLCTLSSTKHKIFYFFEPLKHGPKPFTPRFFDLSPKNNAYYIFTSVKQKITNWASFKYKGLKPFVSSLRSSITIRHYIGDLYNLLKNYIFVKSRGRIFSKTSLNFKPQNLIH